MGERESEDWGKGLIRQTAGIRRRTQVHYLPNKLQLRQFKQYRRASLPEVTADKGQVSLPLFPFLQKKQLCALLNTSLQGSEERKRRPRGVSASSFWTRSLQGMRKGCISFDKVRRSTYTTIALLDHRATQDLSH